MKTIKFIILLTIFATPHLFASDLDINHWSDYSGNLEGKPINMSLYRFSNNQVRGHYYLKGTCTKTYLAGSLKNKQLKLYVIKNNQVTSIFKGYFITNDRDRLEGTCVSNDKTTKEFKLVLTSTIASNYKSRYSLQNVTTTEAETFAKKVKKAIIERNKKWLSDNIHYPITLNFNGKQKRTIKNKKEFLRNYDIIFHSTFIKKVKEFECVDMFCNYQGLMLGAGEIWMNCITVTSTNNCKMTITAINN